MELLPSRAPLCFRLRSKSNSISWYKQITYHNFSLQFDLLNNTYLFSACKLTYTPLFLSEFTFQSNLLLQHFFGGMSPVKLSLFSYLLLVHAASVFKKNIGRKLSVFSLSTQIVLLSHIYIYCHFINIFPFSMFFPF